MKTRAVLLPAACFLAIASLLHADLDLSVVAEIRLGKAAPPPPPEVEVIVEPAQKGPPPWAPAHGFRRNRGYYFYPGANVYYRPADRTWFYLDGREWRVGVNLPTSLRIDFTKSVPLEMETDRPFEFHAGVVDRYPGDYFTKKVKIKGAAGKPQKIHAKPEKISGKPDKSPASTEGGSGKGKGKGKDR